MLWKGLEELDQGQTSSQGMGDTSQPQYEGAAAKHVTDGGHRTEPVRTSSWLGRGSYIPM